MQRLLFSIHINAPVERVWNVLWGEATYGQWVAPFGDGMRAVSDWQVGSRVHFLSPEGDGMYSIIDRKEEHAFMGFTHLGLVLDGQELPTDVEAREWAGSREAYALQENHGGTDLSLMVDIRREDAPSLTQLVPEALGIVRVLAELRKTHPFEFN
jgi:uncharacterized protein YndB with AHSA1/START domain